MHDPITVGIRLLNTLAQKLKAKRMAAGALNLASPEVKIHLDSAESSDPIDVEQKEMLETNSLVEEFMLLANISVARKNQETFPATAVLRRHMPPPATNFEKLKDILQKRKGMTVDVSSSGALAASLDRCIVRSVCPVGWDYPLTHCHRIPRSQRSTPSCVSWRHGVCFQPNISALEVLRGIRSVTMGLQAPSTPTSRVQFGGMLVGYFWLSLSTVVNTNHRCHPIDVLAHRQLSAAIGYTPLHPSLHSKPHVERTLEVVNRRHRLAQMAGRASVEFYVGLALKARGEHKKQAQSTKSQGDSSTIEVREEAFVIRTFRNGFGVFVFK